MTANIAKMERKNHVPEKIHRETATPRKKPVKTRRCSFLRSLSEKSARGSDAAIPRRHKAMMLTIGTSAGWSNAIFWSCGIAGESGDGVMAMARGGCAALLIDGNGRCRVTPELVATAVRRAICGALRNAQVVWRSNMRMFLLRMVLVSAWTAAAMVLRSRDEGGRTSRLRASRGWRESSQARDLLFSNVLSWFKRKLVARGLSLCEERRIGGT